MRLEQRGLQLFCAVFDDGGVVRVSHIRETSGGYYRGLVELLDGDVLLHGSMANLCTSSGRRAVAQSQDGTRDRWAPHIDAACTEIVSRLMRGIPPVEIRAEDQVAPQRYLLDPLLPLDVPTMLFGKPGSTKSYMALLTTILVQLPWTANPFGWKVPSKPSNALFLDNETSQHVIHRRLQELLRGMDLPPALRIHYKRLSGPLAAELDGIQKTVMEHDIGLVILYSAGKAAGGDINSAQSVNDFFVTLNQLGTTSLIVHHQPKPAKENPNNKSPYGSAYFEANARSVWHIERGEGVEDNFVVRLKHVKSNDSALHRPIGLKVQFSQGPAGKAVRFQPADLIDTEFAGDLPMWERCREALQRCVLLSVKDLAAETGAEEASVRTALNRHKDVFHKEGDSWGLLP